jgi:hypothetical protein
MEHFASCKKFLQDRTLVIESAPPSSTSCPITQVEWIMNLKTATIIALGCTALSVLFFFFTFLGLTVNTVYGMTVLSFIRDAGLLLFFIVFYLRQKSKE